MNILPSVAQTSPDATQPVNAPQPGILNNSGDDAAMAMAMKMIQPPQQNVAPLQPINYAKPTPVAFDPSIIRNAILGRSSTSPTQ
jgi:hypothetical protein